MWRLPTLRPSPNPIIVRELRTRMRGARPYIVLSLFLMILVAVGYGFFSLIMQQQRFGGTILSPQIGQALFSGLAFTQLILVVFLAPAMTSAAISGEREQLTYELLVATPLPPIRILWGKLIGALSYLFLLIFASVPIYSVVLMFGGVDLLMLAKTIVLLIITTITCGTIGIFCSSIYRRTSLATLVSYGVIVFSLLATAILSAVWGSFSNPVSRQAPPPVLYANPFSALFSIVTTVNLNPQMVTFGDGNVVGRLPFLDAIAGQVIYYGREGAIIVPIYRGTFFVYAMIIVLLAWLSSHLVQPRRRWQLRRSDFWFAGIWLTLTGLIWWLQEWWYVAPPPMW